MSCAVIDAVQYLVIALYGGVDNAYSYFLVVNLNADAPAPLHVWLLYPSVLSTFVLGNAMRYKHNIIITLGIDIAIAIAIAIVCMIITAVEFRYRDYQGGYTPFLETKAAEGIWTLLLVAAIILCWWTAFRLYSRAQITTRRNR